MGPSSAVNAMKPTVGLLVDYTHGWEKTSAYMRESVERLGGTFVEVHPRQLEFQNVGTGQALIDTSTGSLAKLPDVLVARGGGELGSEHGNAVARFMEDSDIPVLNGAQAVATARNKVETGLRLHAAGIPHPKSVVLDGPEDVKRAVGELGTPVVMKLPVGAGGAGVNILPDQSTAQQFADTVFALHTRYGPGRAAEVGIDQRLLAQEFIEEAGGSDIRVFVVRKPPQEGGGHEVVASMERIAAEGETRANLQQGGRGVPIELPEHAKEMARKAADAIGLDVAGVDLIRTGDELGFQVVEVNSSPGLTIQEITKIPVSDAMAKLAIGTAQARRGVAELRG